MIGLVVIGNGRTRLLEQTIDAQRLFLPPVDVQLMVDDSGSATVADHLTHRYPDFQVVSHPTNLGMAAAVQHGFDLALDWGCSHVFWLEEDMALTAPIPLEAACQILDDHPELAQVAWRRQPLNPLEQHDGCVLRATVTGWPHTIADRYTIHNRIFTLNPCVIPRRILELGWDRDNEAGMTRRLRDAGYKVAWWGHPGDGCTWVEHIGTWRAAAWKL